jgi:hypothetical protein
MKENKVVNVFLTIFLAGRAAAGVDVIVAIDVGVAANVKLFDYYNQRERESLTGNCASNQHK